MNGHDFQKAVEIEETRCDVMVRRRTLAGRVRKVWISAGIPDDGCYVGKLGHELEREAVDAAVTILLQGLDREYKRLTDELRALGVETT